MTAGGVVAPGIKKGGSMKTFYAGLAAIGWISGLILAGSETQGFGNQVILSTAGTLIFVISSLILINILRGKDDSNNLH